MKFAKNIREGSNEVCKLTATQVAIELYRWWGIKKGICKPWCLHCMPRRSAVGVLCCYHVISFSCNFIYILIIIPILNFNFIYYWDCENTCSTVVSMFCRDFILIACGAYSLDTAFNTKILKIINNQIIWP